MLIPDFAEVLTNANPPTLHEKLPRRVLKDALSLVDLPHSDAGPADVISNAHLLFRVPTAIANSTHAMSVLGISIGMRTLTRDRQIPV